MSKRHLQMKRGNVCSARKSGTVKLRDRNQPKYGPPIIQRALRFGRWGTDRPNRSYSRRGRHGYGSPPLNPVMLLGAQMATALLGVFAASRAFISSRRKAPRGA